jgi:hypothetical protein
LFSKRLNKIEIDCKNSLKKSFKMISKAEIQIKPV